MAFQSLNRVLDSLESQYKRREQQHFQQILACWIKVVGPEVASQTRPLKLQRDVLRVATSSPAWAQNLVFERQRILDKLNRQLAFRVEDIRFSAAQWHATQLVASFPGEQYQNELWRAHPSRLSDAVKGRLAPLPEKQPPEDVEVNNPVAAYSRWQAMMKARSQHLPLCPECQCPTPTSELERWQMCAICIAHRW